MVPVATVFRQWVEQGRGWFALGEIVLFLGILFVGLVYVWAKGDLDWLKKVSPSAEAYEETLPKAA
jgi:NADH-quinone oxidoreductase subunit A